MIRYPDAIRPLRKYLDGALLTLLAPCFLPGVLAAPFRGDTLTVPIPVEAGWNLLSLPVDAADPAKELIFPASVSDAFIYDAGYAAADSLTPGSGFWIKFAAAETVTVMGVHNEDRRVTLRAGWNLIGGVSGPVAATELPSTPAGIVVSEYFGFLPGTGYRSSDTLWPGKGYWVKAATAGTLRLAPATCPLIVDYAGKTYNTVTIGDQCWLRENLDLGEMIPGVTDQSQNGVVEKYCYDDDTANCALYGGLYLWDEAMEYVTTPGARGLCPPGWHIPTAAEFDSLGAAVDSDGNALKMAGQGTGEGAGTNTSGFSALLAGSRGYYGNFYNADYAAYFLSSTEYDGQTADYLSLLYNDGSYSVAYDYGKLSGFSLRCLKD
jgi:uncharacterized protein (TIGR02145 family)